MTNFAAPAGGRPDKKRCTRCVTGRGVRRHWQGYGTFLDLQREVGPPL